MPTHNFRVGEMLNKRTENSKTWMNFDGSFTTEVFLEPLHFKDEHGNYLDINTDLFDEADFDMLSMAVSAESTKSFIETKEVAESAKRKRILNREDYGYQGLKVPFDIKVPRNFKKGYSIGKGKDKIIFTPVQASPSYGELSASDRSSIHYQDVWNDTDVELKVLPNGIKETMILKTDKAPTSFSFEVKGKEIGEDFTAGALQLQPAWLIDAAGTQRDVGMTINRKNDNKIYIDVVADTSELVYPIEIDPTVIIPADSATWDAMTVQSGTGKAQRGSSEGAVGFDGYSIRFATMIKPDLSVIPANSVINNVVLTLMKTNFNNPEIVAKRLLAPWVAGTTTYAGRPAKTDAGMASASIDTSGAPFRWKLSITDMVKYWMANPTQYHGIELTAATENTMYGYFGTHLQTNNTYKPTLTISYNPIPTKPTVTTPNGGENWNAEHTITWLGSTDNRGTTDSDATYSGFTFNWYQYATGDKLIQVMKVNNEGLIKRIGVHRRMVSGTASVPVRLVGISAETGLPNGIVYATGQITANTSAVVSYMDIDTAITKIALKEGDLIGIEISNVANLQLSRNGDYKDGYVIINGVRDTLTVNEFYTVLEYEAYVENSLQYQIQLTTNNGSTWKDIVPLTTKGPTSRVYDFTNEPETSLAKIRIRAFDGVVYGDWDESNGVFTIMHNQAPTAPTNLLPNGGAKDRAQPVRFSWTHNDPNAGDPQSKFDIQWRPKGMANWNTFSSASTNQYGDIANLPYGEIEWRVRTYDQAGLVSPYSDVRLFLAGNKPAVPYMIAPLNAGSVDVANPVLQWSAPEQVEYSVQIKNTGGTLVWSDQKITTNKAVTVSADLSNQTSYQVEVSVKNNDGLWSEKRIITITVSYTPPAKTELSILGFDYQGIIQLSMFPKTPTGTEPSVTHHDIYRRKQRDSDWKRIAVYAPANGGFNDSTPASGQPYEYFVRAWGNNGTYRDSSTVSGSIQLSSIWLLDPLDPESLHHFHYFEPGRTAERTFSGQLMEFEGRTQFMAEFSSRETNKVNVVLQLKKESDDLAALHNLLSRRTTLLYRDAKGRRLFGAIFVLSENETDYGYTVPVEVQAVSYEEEV